MNANYSVFLLILTFLPFVGGVLCWIIGSARDRRTVEGSRPQSFVSILITAIEWILVMILLSVRHNGLNVAFPSLFGLGIGFELDGLRWILCLIAVTVWLAVAVYGRDYLRQSNHWTRYKLFFLLQLFLRLFLFSLLSLYQLHI